MSLNLNIAPGLVTAFGYSLSSVALQLINCTRCLVQFSNQK